jgi:hypothetical protein
MQSLMTPAAPPRWNTLQILKASRIALIALDALLLIVAIASAHVHRNAVKTVGVDSAPSIIAAQHIKSALADMDANAANELLGAPGGSPEFVRAYETRRVEAAKALIAAAENITYGDWERAPIQQLQVGLGTYERLIQRARDLHERGDAQFVVAYRDAAALMDRTLLPAADALDKANHDVLEQTYRSESGVSFWARALLLVTGLLALVALAAVQVFLSRRTRRTFNPLLVAATVVALGALGYSNGAMTTAHRQLKVAKEDAFTSIHALWRARAVSYWANADETRYLLDQAHAPEHQRNFLAKSTQLAQLPPGMRPGDVATAEQGNVHPEGFSGYLADELRNITFDGEREAAVGTLLRFEEYLAIDRTIRGLEQEGKHKEAIALCIGANQGDSNWAFDRFDKALDATLAINQAAFDAAVHDGLATFDRIDLILSVMAGAIAVLIFLGLAVRIREYQ